MKKFFLLFILCIPLGLFAKSIETFYGKMEVEEPVILELIESPPMQRLKKLHQYGVSYYTNFSEEFSRYDHSIGVFAILRMKGASLNEQIAGLLHDVSHTIFSHVGDYIFNHQFEKDAYQDNIHEWFLERYGIGKILRAHRINVKDILHKNGDFTALEQDIPELCADRIDYNLQGAFHQDFLTKEEILELLEDLEFVSGKWISTKVDLMKKMALFPLYMTPNLWGSAQNYLESQWLSEIIRRAVAMDVLTQEDIFFGTDDSIWKRLHQIRDSFIQDRFYLIMHASQYFTLIDSNKVENPIRLKFRGVDPWIKQGNKTMRLTAIDKEIRSEYHKVKKLMEQGWGIKQLPTSFAYNQLLP